MPTSLIVVDDFLDDPYPLRHAALQMEYPASQSNFPGRNSARQINIEGLHHEVSRLVGEPLLPMSHNQAHGNCRISLGSDVGNAKVHVDASHWSGILYLTEPEFCRGGTEFFRHIPTNTERAPYSDQECQEKFGVASAQQWTANILDNDTNDASKWEMTMRVPMRFNRLILLRPWLWHTAGESFGDSLENGRLVYLMFFRSAHG
jgi:hypothetical protein